MYSIAEVHRRVEPDRVYDPWGRGISASRTIPPKNAEIKHAIISRLHRGVPAIEGSGDIAALA